MISKTKNEIGESEVKRLFEAAGLTGAENIKPLGAGEYNAIYSADVNGKGYALKIAPLSTVKVLSYEKDMLATELAWYDIIRKNTDIRVPEIVYRDNSCKLIPSTWFIMERLPGNNISESTDEEGKARGDEIIAKMLAKLHTIKGEKFGYIQNGLHDSWYLALRSMCEALLADAKSFGKRSKNGEKLLKYIDEYKEVLERAECCAVNFDLWLSNVMLWDENGERHYALIDPERSFWGDRVFDSVCLGFGVTLDKNKGLELYNKYSENKMGCSRDEQIRAAFAQGYLALIMEVERYSRYTWLHFGWWRNVAAVAFLSKSCFSVLEK